MVGIDAEPIELVQAGLAMRSGSGGVAALVVALLLEFLDVPLSPLWAWQVAGVEKHIGSPTDLLHGQQFAAGNQAGGRKLLTHPGAE